MTTQSGATSPTRPPRAVHPIEAESYRILRSRVDTRAMEPWTRAVVERMADPRVRIVELPLAREDLETDIRLFTEDRALNPIRWMTSASIT